MPTGRWWRLIELAIKVVLAMTGIVVALAAVFFVAMAALFGEFDHHADDAELINTFAEHRPTFERLVAMADADSLIGDIPAANTFDVHPSPPLHGYQAALDTLRLAGGIQRRVSGDTTIVTLTAWSQGLVNAGSDKGYAFSRTPLTPLFPTLDDRTAIRTSRHGTAYRAIAANWYLLYNW